MNRLTTLFVLVVFASCAQAGVLVDPVVVDYFDTADDGGDLRDTTSVANNEGWADNTYTSGTNRLDVASNLTFSNPDYADADSGNGARVVMNNRAGGRYLASDWGGTIWMSYLVQLYDTNGASTGVGLRDGYSGYGSDIDGVDYVYNSGAGGYEAGSALLLEDQTYLAVVRYELSSDSSSLTAWHFAEGDTIPMTEAELDAMGEKLTKSDLGELSADNTANFLAYRGSSLHVDSFRLTDVGGDAGLTHVIVPEPATMGLLAMGALALLNRRRR